MPIVRTRTFGIHGQGCFLNGGSLKTTQKHFLIWKPHETTSFGEIRFEAMVYVYNRVCVYSTRGDNDQEIMGHVDQLLRRGFCTQMLALALGTRHVAARWEVDVGRMQPFLSQDEFKKTRWPSASPSDGSRNTWNMYGLMYYFGKGHDFVWQPLVPSPTHTSTSSSTWRMIAMNSTLRVSNISRNKPNLYQSHQELLDENRFSQIMIQN